MVYSICKDNFVEKKNISIESFEKNGYQIGEPILDSVSVKEIREKLDEQFVKLSSPNLISIDSAENDLYRTIVLLLNSAEVTNFLDSIEKSKQVPISVFPVFQIMRNYYPHPWLLNGWHSDCGGELKYDYCVERLKHKDYVFGKIGIYLQENGDLGGSIDVVPKSHIPIRTYSNTMRRLMTVRLLIYTKIHKLNSWIFKYIPRGLQNLLVGGKMLKPPIASPVFFDSGILHRGTSPIKERISSFKFEDNLFVNNTSKEETKYAIYFQFGSVIGAESYLYDRMKREEGQFERSLWEKQLPVLSRIFPEMGAKLAKLFKQLGFAS